LFTEVDVSFLCKKFTIREENVTILCVAVEDTENVAWEVLQQDLKFTSSCDDFIEDMY
jgi:hypothetical protein